MVVISIEVYIVILFSWLGA